MKPLRLVIPSQVKDVDEKQRTIHFIGSDESFDRYQDVIKAEGWRLADYKKNPVFLWAHQYKLPPLGAAKKVWVNKEAKKLEFMIRFAKRETFRFADTIYRLYKELIMNAVSVGFQPDWDKISYPNPEADEWEGKPAPRRVFNGQDLLELSAVPVPANPNALQDALAKGVISEREYDALWERDDEHGIYLPKDTKFFFFEQDPFHLIGDEFTSGDDDTDPDMDTVDDGFEDGIDECEEKEERAAKSTKVQSLIFAKKKFDKEEAIGWAKEHKFKADKVDETAKTWRLRQIPPDDCQAGSFRTISLDKGVKASICRPKAKTSATAAELSFTGAFRPTREVTGHSDLIVQDQNTTTGAITAEKSAPAKDERPVCQECGFRLVKRTNPEGKEVQVCKVCLAESLAISLIDDIRHVNSELHNRVLDLERKAGLVITQKDFEDRIDRLASSLTKNGNAGEREVEASIDRVLEKTN